MHLHGRFIYFFVLSHFNNWIALKIPDNLRKPLAVAHLLLTSLIDKEQVTCKPWETECYYNCFLCSLKSLNCSISGNILRLSISSPFTGCDPIRSEF